MTPTSASARRLSTLSGLAAIIGVLMIGVSFGINPSPPSGASAQQLIAFGQEHLASILWGAWLQAVGPVLIAFFALAVVHLGGAAQRLEGWMTLLGASLLMIVSLAEIVFYIGALFTSPDGMPLVSLDLIHAVQHLYLVVAAPGLFVPLGIVIVGTRALPALLGWLALLVGGVFFVAGVFTMTTLVLPDWVTAMGAVQALWWLAAVIVAIVRGTRTMAA